MTIITEVEFQSADSSDQLDQNYLKHLAEELEKAANRLSLRSIRDARVAFCGGGVMGPSASSEGDPSASVV